MKNKAISKVSKIVIGMQIAFILLSFYFAYNFIPIQEYPKDNEKINENFVDFKFRNANVIFIDDNNDFSSPLVFNSKDIKELKFKPGKYYWKVGSDIFESSYREFEIDSKVGLDIIEENSSLKNTGNVPINLTKESESGISGLSILDVSMEYPVQIKEKNEYRGEQYDEK